MVGMKCRTSIIQYMPKKPKKFGVKLWVLCESQSGYCLNLQIYKGKEGDNQESGLAYRVVMDLMRVYLYRNHYLFVDNYCTSPKLFLDLNKINLPVRQFDQIVANFQMNSKTPNFQGVNPFI